MLLLWTSPCDVLRGIIRFGWLSGESGLLCQTARAVAILSTCGFRNMLSVAAHPRLSSMCGMLITSFDLRLFPVIVSSFRNLFMMS